MNKDILLGIVNNAILLLGLGVIYSLLPLDKSKRKIVSGLTVGIPLSIIVVFVMASPFQITQGVVLDTRSILISVAAFFFGLIPTIMVVITASIYRFISGGDGALIGVLVIISSGIIGLLFRKLRYDKIINRKTTRLMEFYLFLLLVHIIMLLLFLGLPGGVGFDIIKDISFWVMLIYPILGVLYAALIFLRFDNESNIKQMIKNLKYAANYDFLTGVSNRRYYEDNLMELDRKDNYPISIVVADINGLKLINDAFGHKFGDELLISAAKIIAETCEDNNIVARIGGDEFAIVMPNTSKVQAEKKITEIKNKCEKVKIKAIKLSVSFGCSTKTRSNQKIENVYGKAEDLMYREKLLEIPSMRSGAIETILVTLYEKDKNSEAHSRRVASISVKIAECLGMDRQDIAEVKTAGLLHDIGKIIIPLPIINKIGKLTNEEYAIIKNHPEIGFRILNSTADMRSISNVVLNHHERWDGNGYPRGIKGEDIPLQSRIVSLADAFDAMTSVRSYRDTFTNSEALQEVISNAGTQFDPHLVKIFENHFSDIVENLEH